MKYRITKQEGTMAEIIIGTGAAVPDYVLDNDGVAEIV